MIKIRFVLCALFLGLAVSFTASAQQNNSAQQPVQLQKSDDPKYKGFIETGGLRYFLAAEGRTENRVVRGMPPGKLRDERYRREVFVDSKTFTVSKVIWSVWAEDYKAWQSMELVDEVDEIKQNGKLWRQANEPCKNATVPAELAGFHRAYCSGLAGGKAK